VSSMAWLSTAAEIVEHPHPLAAPHQFVDNV
jgi:hypothetical protein